MNERDFFYWLKGFFEMTDTDSLSPEQVRMIKDHMDLVACRWKTAPGRSRIFNPDEEVEQVDPYEIRDLPTTLTC